MFFRRILSIKIEFTKCSVKHSRLGKPWEFLKLRVARVVHGNSVVISDACMSRSLPYVLCRKEDGVNALKRVEVYRSCHRNCVRLSLLAKFLYYTHTGAQYQCKLISVLRFRNVSSNALFFFQICRCYHACLIWQQQKMKQTTKKNFWKMWCGRRLTLIYIRPYFTHNLCMRPELPASCSAPDAIRAHLPFVYKWFERFWLWGGVNASLRDPLCWNCYLPCSSGRR